DGEKGIFAAFIEFAFRHTVNDLEAYENAAQNASERNQKILFIQLSCRKKEVFSKLKMQRADHSILHATVKSQNKGSSLRFQKKTENDILISLEDALNFATQRESGTLEVYKKLEKIMQFSSTKTLFEYLVKSQNSIIDFLYSQRSVSRISRMNETGTLEIGFPRVSSAFQPVNS
ncbi:MAG TPA: hypothetical protein VF335_07840, partial [Chitinivibrionales bacterium]